jgi:microcin C transport system ATP-binding protein
MQVVFQDPYGSLSPRLSVNQIVAEGLVAHGIGTEAERDARVIEALEGVGLDQASRHRYPHEFSGGPRQRIALARAMIMQPDVLVLDEPTSALDRSVQVQMIDLLQRLQQEHALAYLFISHDLRVIRALSDQIIVMRRGKVVEQGHADTIFSNPTHPYTRALMSAAFDLAVSDESAIAQ